MLNSENIGGIPRKLSDFGSTSNVSDRPSLWYRFVVSKIQRCFPHVSFAEAFSIASYCVISLSVVYFNHWVFTVGFKYPVFVSWIQQVVGVVLFFVFSRLSGSSPFLRTLFPTVRVQTRILLRILPLSCSFCLMVALANICLQRTLISTYQVARSLSLFFIIILSYFMLGQRQSVPVLLSCTLMVTGFIAGSLDPSTISLTGLLAGAFSSLFQSLYNVLIKKSLQYVDGDNQVLLSYNLLLSAFLFFPLVIICEGAEPFVAAFGGLESGHLYAIWASLVFGGVLGTSLNMSTYWCVKATSPLTFNIVGFAKALLQSLGGIVFMGDHVSVASGIGMGLVFTGTGAYSAVKAKENARERQAKAAEIKVPPEDGDIEMEERSSTDEFGRTESSNTSGGMILSSGGAKFPLSN